MVPRRQQCVIECLQTRIHLLVLEFNRLRVPQPPRRRTKTARDGVAARDRAREAEAEGQAYAPWLGKAEKLDVVGKLILSRATSKF
jgi:hypothetical protein